MFIVLLAVFLLAQIVLPAVRASFKFRANRSRPRQFPAPVAAALLLGGLLWLATGHASAAATQSAARSSAKEPALAESITQEIRVEEKFALATARIRWHASKDQMLPLLFERPCSRASATRPTRSSSCRLLSLRSAPTSFLRSRTARSTSSCNTSFTSRKRRRERLHTADTHALVNRLTLTLPDLDVDVVSPNAVSVQRDNSSTNTTVATLVLAPVADSWIGWKPRSRDVKHEKAVFFAELFQLYVPAAGVIEGVHQVQLRPAQGELNELIFDVPAARPSRMSSTRRRPANPTTPGI